MKPLAAILMVLAATGLVGCRCAPGFDCYANFIDGVHDRQLMWDQWYSPRLDISRAGRPDWCGPINRRLGPCRCCNQGCWDRADECWRYPAAHPYVYPSRTLSMNEFYGPVIETQVIAPQPESLPPNSSLPIPPMPADEGVPQLLPPAPPPAPAF